MTLAACLHTLLLRTTYTACHCSLPSRRNITVITFCKHLRLQFYCTPLLPVPQSHRRGTSSPSQSNFAIVRIALCTNLKSRNAQRQTQRRRTTNLATYRHTDIRMYTCTYVHMYVQESTCITRVTAKSSSARNESVTVINFYNGSELRATK